MIRSNSAPRAMQEHENMSLYASPLSTSPSPVSSQISSPHAPTMRMIVNGKLEKPFKHSGSCSPVSVGISCVPRTDHFCVVHLPHLDIAPTEAPIDKPPVEVKLPSSGNCSKKSSMTSSRNPFGSSSDSDDALPEISPAVSPLAHHRTDADSGCNVDLTAKTPFFAHVQNFNPFGDSSDEDDHHRLKQTLQAAPVQKPPPPTRPESIYGGSIYSSMKRRAPAPPKMSERDKLMLDLLEMNRQMGALELVWDKINCSINQSEFLDESRNMAKNRLNLVDKKLDLCDKLEHLIKSDQEKKLLARLRKINNKTKNNWRSMLHRNEENRILTSLRNPEQQTAVLRRGSADKTGSNNGDRRSIAKHFSVVRMNRSESLFGRSSQYYN